MRIDWQSAQTEILINPRYPGREKDTVFSSLSETVLKGHFWLASSGSSGQTKWTALSKSALLTSAASVNQHLQSDSKDIWVNPLPIFHVGGLSILARSYLTSAKVIDLSENKWDPLQYYKKLKETKGTLTSLVPSLVFDLVKLGLPSPPSLRAVLVGGGFLSENLYKQGRALGWPLLPTYGMTECSSQIATASYPLENDPLLKILPHVKVKVHLSGNIQIKSESLFTVIANLTLKKIILEDSKEDGWFTTEDKGEIKENYLKVLGRNFHFIKIGAESVDLVKLENILNALILTLKSTKDFVLIPFPDERLGAVIHLVTNCQDEIVLKSLCDQYSERVLPFEKIRRIHYLESIPKSPLHKVLYGELIQKVT